MAVYHRGCHDHRHRRAGHPIHPRLPRKHQTLVAEPRAANIRRKSPQYIRDISNKQQDWRLQNENAGIEDTDPKSLTWGVKQGMRDPKLYMFIGMQMSLITAQSFNNFFPSIVGTLGYSDTITLLLTAPPYFAAFICSLCISFHAAHTQERGLHIAIPLLFSFLGNLLVSAHHHSLSNAPTKANRTGHVHPHNRRPLLQHVPHDSRLLLPLQPVRILAKLVPAAPQSKTGRRTRHNEPYGRGRRPLLHLVHVPRFPATEILRGRRHYERGVLALCCYGAGD